MTDTTPTAPLGTAGAIDTIERESERFAAVLTDADPAARVPTCPEWSAADLLWHLTEVHLFWGAVLARAPQSDAEVGEIEEGKPARPETVELMLPVRRDATAALVEQLRALPDDASRWSWWPADQTAGFTRRMQTYEATMHRVDAELAAGLTPSTIPADVAAGAVDHCVDVMWGWLPEWAAYEPLSVVELQATDTAQRWLVEIGHWTGVGPESGTAFDEMRAVRADGGEAEATVVGTAEQLARWAWSRVPQEGSIQVAGSEEARAVVDRLIAAGIQ